MNRGLKGIKYFLICAVLISAYFLCPSMLYAQSYRVYRPSPVVEQATPTTSTKLTFLSSLSLSAWSSASFADISDTQGNVLSEYMTGFSLAGMYKTSENLYLGLEWGKYESKDSSNLFIPKMSQEQIGGIIKWVFTSDTQPQMYVLGGFGQVKNKAQFSFESKKEEKYSQYLLGGTGLEYKIKEWIKVGGEYRLKYTFSPWESKLLKEDPFRHEFSLGLWIGF